MPEKIILLTPAHPLRGGIAASSERLALALQQSGYEVVLYSFTVQYPAFLFPGKTQFTDDPPPPGLLIKTRLNSINPLNWLLVGRQVALEQADHIIVRFWLPFMGPALGTVLRAARWFSRKRFKITGLIDNIVPHEKRFGDRSFARYFVNACDDFVAMSHSVQLELQQFLRPKHFKSAKNPDEIVRFAPHPIYDNYGDPVAETEARQLLGLPQSVPLVLFFGFVRAYKGLDLLLKALGKTPGVHTLIAGECYDEWSDYQDIIEKNQLGDRVHLKLDFIPADQVRLYFSAADLVVQPYKSATQSGISQIAYHFDKPMVVTDVGGLPEIVTAGVSGYVVAPDETAIAGAINDFFREGRSETLFQGIQVEKRRFSWNYLIAQLLR